MNRNTRLALAAALVAAFVVAVVWYEWFPNYRPNIGRDESFGIDVSHHQGPIQWTNVGADDIEFAYIKATEGLDHADTRFAENWIGAATAGIDRGAYHFFTLCSPGSEQAAQFLSVLPQGEELLGDSAVLSPAVDLELAGNCEDRPPAADVRVQLSQFIADVEAGTGREIVLYLGDDFDHLYPVEEYLDRPLWRRRIGRRPSTDDWDIWQFSSESEVDGIDGPVDMNVMRVPE